MEQVAIITKLVEEMIAMNCGERQMAHFILNLDCAVRTLTHIKEDAPRQTARDLRWEAGREEREAKEAKAKEDYRAKREAEEAEKKEAQRERRRELYHLKKMKGKICDRCEEFPAEVPKWNWCENCYFQHSCDSLDCKDDNCVCLPRKEKCVRKQKKVDWRSKICKFCGGHNEDQWCVSCCGEKK